MSLFLFRGDVIMKTVDAGLLRKWGWWIFFWLYIVASLLYQAWGQVLDYSRYSNVEVVRVSPCVNFKFRIPKQIPVAGVPSNDFARPIVVWGWRGSQAICNSLPEEVEIQFLDGDRLLFTNTKDVEAASNMMVKLGNDEHEAPRQFTYIYVPLTDKQISQASLKVLALDMQVAEWEINVQTPFISGLFRFANILFGIPIVTALGSIVAVVGFYVKQQEKRRADVDEFESSLEKIKNQRERQNIGISVKELFPKANELDIGFVERLEIALKGLKKQNKAGNIWSFELRNEAVTRWETENFPAWLEETHKATGFPENQEDREALEWFSKWLQNRINPTDTDEPFLKALKVFRVLGMKASTDVIKKLNEYLKEKLKALTEETSEKRSKEQLEKQKPTDYLVSQVVKHLYDEGQGAGRYLLRRIEHEAVKQKLREKQNGTPIPPNRISQPLWPWPEQIRFQVPGEFVKKGKPYPFGPLKAEDDPRLPRTDEYKGLFWDDHPVWRDSISQPESATYLLELGGGTTTFIWMGRRERRFWGKTPSLSVYFRLTGEASAEKVWRSVETGFSESLLFNLAEDPYWLLDAENSVQEQVSRFLLGRFGETRRLLGRLNDLCLPAHEQMALADLLIEMETLPAYRPEELFDTLAGTRNAMFGAAYERVSGTSFDIFFWAELQKTSPLKDWQTVFEKTGLSSAGIVKVFSTEESGSDVHGIPVRWTKENIKLLLEHRNKSSWQDTGWNTYMNQQSVTKFLKSAGSTPRSLISYGNQILDDVLKKAKT